MKIREGVIKFLGKALTPVNKIIIEPFDKYWPYWLSPRRLYIRFIVTSLAFIAVIAGYLYNFKLDVYPTLAGDAASQSCAVLPKFMQKGIGPTLASTDWFPSYITTMPRNYTDWFYSFWQTLDWMLALSMGLAAAFTVYAVLKVIEIRSRAMALGEGRGAGVAREAGMAAGAGAATTILVTLATCWGPVLLTMIFGVTVVSFSGATGALFQFTIPKPFVLLFVVTIVIAGTWWMKRKEQACHLLEGE